MSYRYYNNDATNTTEDFHIPYRYFNSTNTTVDFHIPYISSELEHIKRFDSIKRKREVEITRRDIINIFMTVDK